MRKRYVWKMQNATIFCLFEIDRQAALKCFPTHLNNYHGQGVDDGIWYWSVPDQHVLPGGEVYKGIDGPRLIQASKSPCLKGCIMKWIKQAIPNPPLCRPLEKTSSPPDLHAFEQVLVVCWRLCAPSSPCHQLSTSVPWYLGNFIKRILVQRNTFFQQHRLLPTRDYVRQIPSPENLAFFKASQKLYFQYNLASSFVLKAVVPGATPQLILETTPVRNLNRARACSLKSKNIFDPVSFHFSIYLQHQVAALVNKCTVYNAQFFQHHIKYMVLAPGWSMRCLFIGSYD